MLAAQAFEPNQGAIATARPGDGAIAITTPSTLPHPESGSSSNLHSASAPSVIAYGVLVPSS